MRESESIFHRGCPNAYLTVHALCTLYTDTGGFSIPSRIVLLS